MLIEDKKTLINSASMSVRIGSMNDPYDLAGASHFLEHLVFMGSTKYPSEDLFTDIISKNNG